MVISRKTKPKKHPSSMKNTLYFIWRKARPYKKPLAILTFITLLTEAITLVAPFIAGKLVDTFSQENFEVRQAIILVAIGLATALLSRFLWIIKQYVDFEKFYFDFRKDVSMNGLQKILQLSVGQHLDKNSGIKDAILTKGVNSIKMLVEALLYNFLPTVLKMITLVIALFIMDWQIGLFIFLVTLVIIYMKMNITSTYIPKFRELETLGQDRSKGFSEILRNISLLKNSGREEYGYRHVDNLFLKEQKPAKKYWISFLNKMSISNFLVALSSAAIMIIVVFKIHSGEMSPGMFVVISSWSGMLFAELYMLQYIQRVFATNIPAIQEFEDFMEIKPSVKVLKNPEKIKSFKGKISFKQVSFNYPDDANDSVLVELSFEIKPGETIGVVGRSGSGKSTFLKLLLRNYDPTKGSILIEGVDLRKLDLSWYLQHIGYVEQSTQLFDTTIRENLSFATSEQLSEEDFERAIAQAGLTDFIAKLPNGLDTKIGEQGVKLSGGQRQRLAIARALIKRPKLLILDEATASLDSEKEREIQEAIDNLAKENISATKIIIAHRLSTIVNADRIFVFDEGNIIDIGTHRELLERCAIYQNLYNIQHQTALI
jgi:ATP-binding cassette subfamily B protein